MLYEVITEWLSINGEAIYNTRPWEKFGEGPTVVENGHHSEGKNKEFTSEDIRFTQTDNALYAIVLDVPQGKNILIKSLANCSAINNRTIKSVECVGDETVITSYSIHYTKLYDRVPPTGRPHPCRHRAARGRTRT